MLEDTKSKQLKYSQLMEELKEKILSGRIQAGDKLPSENELAAQYQVSRQTVRKALAILEYAGYVYAEHGRGTFCSGLVRHTRSSKNIAVVMTYLSDYIFPSIIQGIDTVLSHNGYSFILKSTQNLKSQEARCLEELLQKDIDGMIIEPSKSQIYCRHMNLFEKLDEYHIPYVLIQGTCEQMQDKPYVVVDDYKGGYLITKYLLSLGHKCVAGIFKADDSQGVERHRGYVHALQNAGILYDPDKVVWFYTEDKLVHPYQAIQNIVRKKPKIDGIVCYNDLIAVEVIKALQEIGVRVPQDISVTGYDNSYMASSERFQLTTIVHPKEKMGEAAAELLLQIIQNENMENKRILIEPKLVKGTSCRQRKN